GTTTHVTYVDYLNWTTGIPKAKDANEYVDGSLYRTTHTEWTPNTESHEAHTYVLVSDAQGNPVTRTDRSFLHDRVESEERSTDPVSYGGPGTVFVTNDFDPNTANLTQTTVSRGDGGPDRTTYFTYAAGGFLASKRFGSFPWLAEDRDIDFNTGLPFQ